jgi:lysophospholipase
MTLFRYWIFITLCFLGESAHSTLSHIKMADGARLRIGSWASESSAKSPSKGTIFLMIGRASYLEKNTELIQDLVAMGYQVESFDWRGYGGSDRPLPHTQKCHIDSFDIYLQDFHTYFQHVKETRTLPRPLYVVGISLGGHLAIRYIHEHPQAFQKAALVVPMMDILTRPFPKPLVYPMVSALCALGFHHAYAFGYGDVSLTGPIPMESRETHSQERHQQTHRVMRAHPELVIGGPTFGWVKAAFDSLSITQDPGYLETIQIPIILQTAGQDTTVDTKNDKAYCKKMAHCHHVLYGQSRHNITKEIDSIRGPFLKDLDAFLSTP